MKYFTICLFLFCVSLLANQTPINNHPPIKLNLNQKTVLEFGSETTLLQIENPEMIATSQGKRFLFLTIIPLIAEGETNILFESNDTIFSLAFKISPSNTPDKRTFIPTPTAIPSTEYASLHFSKGNNLRLSLRYRKNRYCFFIFGRDLKRTQSIQNELTSLNLDIPTSLRSLGGGIEYLAISKKRLLAGISAHLELYQIKQEAYGILFKETSVSPGMSGQVMFPLTHWLYLTLRNSTLYLPGSNVFDIINLSTAGINLKLGK